MIELLRAAARRDPDHPAVIGSSSATYGELVELAERVACELVRRRFERIGIVSADPVETLALLAGASAVGVEACALAPDISARGLDETAVRFGHTTVVVPGVLADADVGVDVVLTKELVGRRSHDDSTAADDTLPDVRPHLILTTGTTGTPRGARHDWSRLVGARNRKEPTPHQRWLLAYGVHQFAGLQVILHVIGSGVTLVVPPVNRPSEAVESIRVHGVDHISATPTYWRFLLTEMRAAGVVPELRQITLGGEAVPEGLLAELREIFSEARISQVYASTEFGSTSSVRDGRSGLPVSLLQRGPDADVALKIVEGELWVRSRVGMLGYHGEPETDDEQWCPTGDLVEVVDERILFRGRVAEIINVGGVKVHPLPVEERIRDLPGVHVARVYARPNALTGNIVAAQIVCEPGADEDALREEIRLACADLPDAAMPRSVKFVDEVTTRGGKIVRRHVDA